MLIFWPIFFLLCSHFWPIFLLFLAIFILSPPIFLEKYKNYAWYAIIFLLYCSIVTLESSLPKLHSVSELQLVVMYSPISVSPYASSCSLLTITD